MEDLQNELLSLHNIVKDGDNYKLQNNYHKDGNRIVPVIPYENRDCHNCFRCTRFALMGDSDGHCSLYNRLLGLQESHFAWTSSVINCEAYDPIEKMNIIKSVDEMIKFIENTQNFFGSPEEHEQYYGFQRNWNEETGEILETVREYYNRGGIFTNIPTKYPCVIRFDWECEDDLEWIYIGQ